MPVKHFTSCGSRDALAVKLTENPNKEMTLQKLNFGELDDGLRG
jgi:hypothetical protein